MMYPMRCEHNAFLQFMSVSQSSCLKSCAERVAVITSYSQEAVAQLTRHSS